MVVTAGAVQRPPPGNGPAWEPSAAQFQRSRLLRFMRHLGLDTVDALRERAAADPAWFWEAVIRDLGLSWFRQPDRVLDLSDGLPFAHWFPGGRFNYVSNAVDRHAHGPAADRPALVWEGEEGTTRTLTYRQLLVEVSRAAAALRALGIRRGDRVGIFLPMNLECAIATLACSRIGAIFTPIFSGFAAPAVASRLNDCTARLLITADGFFRRGRLVPLKEVADAAAGAAPSVERLLVVRRAGRTDTPWQPGPRCLVARAGSAAAGHAARRRNRGQRPVHGDLYVGHHRTAEGSRPRPRRLSDQGRAGHGPLLRRPSRRPRVVVHRPRLDDGAVAHLRRPAARRDGLPVRRRAGLASARPASGLRRHATGFRPSAWPRPGCAP